MTEPDSDGTGQAPDGAAAPADRTGSGAQDPSTVARRSDHSPWNWLLVIPVLIPLLTFLFNYDKPRLFGLPAFYWLQMAFIVLGVGATTIVYQRGKRRR